MSWTLKALGAGREVGRSCLLLDAGEKFLFDCGVKLEPTGTEYPLPVDVNLDAIIISHGHLDHSGYLPSLFNKTHTLTYMTQPTLDIGMLLWLDSLKIAGMEGLDAHYTKDQLHSVERFTFPVGYKKSIQITPKTTMEFFDAGHIIGSAITKLSLPGNKSFVYTGDFNGDETRLFNKADLKLGNVDYLLMETTYGNRNHPPRKESEKRFVESVKQTLENGGHALVSAFAVGRSQELVDVLVEGKVNGPIYLDGMCQAASKIFLRYPKFLKNPKQLKKSLNKVQWIKNDSMRRKVLQEPSVVVTTSGMLSGGPIQFYLKKLHMEPKTKLFLTGYQVPETPGRILLETGNLLLGGDMVRPRMSVEKFDFSAHSDHNALVRTVKKVNPGKIIFCHGDALVMEEFKRETELMGFEVLAPKTGETITL